MEPYTKSYNETYLDYIKGKPVPKPVTPPDIHEDDDNESVDCEHHEHDHGSRKSIFETGQFTANNDEYVISKGRPHIQNIKTALEVPPISGMDYTNPSYTQRIEEETIMSQTMTPSKGYEGYTTGLPETAPGHDSILLSKSIKDKTVIKDITQKQTPLKSAFAKSKSKFLGTSRTDLTSAFSSFNTNK